MKFLGTWITKGERRWIVERAARSRFEPGRQGTGYEKFAVPDDELLPLRARGLAAMGFPDDQPHDCWILRYRRGSSIPPHTDPIADGQEHHRLNVIVSRAFGGDLFIGGVKLPLSDREAYTFRPDIEVHSVSEITLGERIVFSIGAQRAADEARPR